MDHDKLKIELQDSKYSAMSDAEVADALNAKTIDSFEPVEYTHVASYLTLVDKYLGLMESATDSARSFKLSMTTFATFDLSKPGVSGAVNRDLDALIADGLIDATDKAVILSLANGDKISRAQELGLGTVKTGDIEYARTI